MFLSFIIDTYLLNFISIFVTLHLFLSNKLENDDPTRKWFSTSWPTWQSPVTHNRLYFQVKEIDGIKIFHYCGALNFASKPTFRSTLLKKIGFKPASVLRQRKKLEEGRYSDFKLSELATKCIIVDFSALTYIDPTGVAFLRLLTDECTEIGVEFYVASCSGGWRRSGTERETCGSLFSHTITFSST